MRRSRGQAMVETALILPVLILFIFGILDFGRGIVAYIQISQAVGEAARAAALAPQGLPDNAAVLAAANGQTGYVSLAPCPNGSATGVVPPSGQAYLFIGNPAAPNANGDGANAPGGQTSGTAGCPVTPAHSSNQDKLQITIVYNFTPFTPLISNVTGSQIVLSSSSVIPVEY